MRLTSPFWVALSAAVAALACGSTSDEPGAGKGGASEYGLPAATVASYEGSYALDAFTRNGVGCDVEGPSAFDSEPDHLFVMVGLDVDTTPTLALGQCADVADCSEQLGAIRRANGISGDYSGYFAQQRDADHLHDGFAQAGSYSSDVCTGRTWYTSDLTRSGDSVRVERRTFPLADVMVDDAACTRPSVTWEQEALDRPCTALMAFSGTKTGPLP